MKIAVLGAGAMGSWFGGKLALGGHEVSLLTTNAAHRAAIAADGLRLRSGRGEQTVCLPALAPADYTGPARVVMLFTKTFQSDAALQSIRAALDDDCHVLTLQNGLGNADTIARYLPLERVLVGTTIMPVDQLAPGVVASAGHGDGHFYSARGDLPIARELERAFLDAGLDVHLDPDIQRRIWSKVAFNVGMNAVAALAHGTPGTIGDSPGARALVEAAAREAIAVAAAQGITLDSAAILDRIGFACENHRDHRPSMLVDLQRGRRTEVDALNGAIVAAGEKLGVATPLNATLTTLLRLAELSHRRYRRD